MININLDISRALDFVKKEDINAFQDVINKNHQNLLNKTGKGDDFLGWVDLPSSISTEFLDEIKADADKMAAKAKVFVVIGIGGSYLGARAVIEALQHQFKGFVKSDRPQVIYAGQNISEDYMVDLMEALDGLDYAVTVISKSGTTTEPALAFRIIKNHLETKYGKEEAADRIIAITDKSRGALKTLADKEGYKTYVVPDDVGGRYSVLTPVGLLPIAVAGFDIHALVKGAVEMQEFNEKNTAIETNPVALYAATRNALYNSGKTTEIMVNYQPTLYYMTEWWKQLYGESEGKENKGIFPAGVSNTTDLHSMGQYIQEGIRNLFETVISVEKSKRKLEIPLDAADLDGLNYLKGKTITEVNYNAELGTAIAHVDGGVPNLRISIPELNEENIGQLIYFYEFACGLSGYILDVNPFDQPGVEAYKKNMFALLGKPGFEEATKAIKARL
ncbi:MULTISPECIES: glucose-6-phosphate isomerase [unclassified Lentimicrobium]|uniref:glucose-6-phosphate isomerase n=1 Tax=unclassified Lentimicrobium TaxID=2677434 RepID=UPI001557A3B7|nr:MULTISPECIES: glucose-6-phosphate isomerase [unclassified Lentimicrobium]NPD46282.1 glucose-6-phosphate isomerase [Lentimicrobium sp. S6]NPD83950.1 glucose-6-phosphate isomerase [Lentimicrobium sp. L6]